MKKYKLLKWYPSCLGLMEGQIITKWIGSAVYSLTRNSRFFNPQEVENNPEFWEEVVEKEYEILSFRRLEDGCIFYITVNGNYTNAFGTRFFDEDLFLKENNRFSIHSVKKLSSGEIFTVGDRVKHKSEETFIIKSIHLGLLGEYEISFNSKLASMSLVEHIKKPLFTTEDGVDIHPKDSYWCVNTAPHLWSLFKQTAKERTMLNKTVIAFKEEALAKEYILMNKPCLSINDIESISTNTENPFGLIGLLKEDLIKIVKSKTK